jgi:hypothetical protein
MRRQGRLLSLLYPFTSGEGWPKGIHLRPPKGYGDVLSNVNCGTRKHFKQKKSGCTTRAASTGPVHGQLGQRITSNVMLAAKASRCTRKSRV